MAAEAEDGSDTSTRIAANAGNTKYFCQLRRIFYFDIRDAAKLRVGFGPANISDRHLCSLQLPLLS